MEFAPIPTFIRWLFRSGVGLNCFEGYGALFRKKMNEEKVRQLIDNESVGADALRMASLVELASVDPSRVERAIFYLMLVGNEADVDAIAAMNTHPSNAVRNGSKTCCFEMRKRHRSQESALPRTDFLED